MTCDSAVSTSCMTGAETTQSDRPCANADDVEIAIAAVIADVMPRLHLRLVEVRLSISGGNRNSASGEGKGCHSVNKSPVHPINIQQNQSVEGKSILPDPEASQACSAERASGVLAFAYCQRPAKSCGISRISLSRLFTSRLPQSAIVRSSSLWMTSSAVVTPFSPIAPRPLTKARPI